MDNKDSKSLALNYHSEGRPGKLEISLTKPTNSREDLSLAYTPGVAEPVKKIHENSSDAYKYTAKGNLVGVITNGTAVLGLGNVGALASKPVMEGKAILFKKFADIDVFDIEVDATNVDDFVDTVARISPTFGGINLEDISAPSCFEIEKKLQQRLDIPVFHDDQHGTAIVVSAGILNALQIQQKDISEVKIICIGAGAAGIASVDLLVHLGAQLKNIFMFDSKGLIHPERKNLNSYKIKFSNGTVDLDTSLESIVDGTDVLIGVSQPGLITKEHISKMASKPIVFALSNPIPEIFPSEALSVRSDIIMATGRSDFPNQVNNVLSFPYLLRGALDARANKITKEMLVASVHAIKDLAQEPREGCEFGPEYIIPDPLDPRLKDRVSNSVKEAYKKYIFKNKKEILTDVN